jgi:hypothetical protein
MPGHVLAQAAKGFITGSKRGRGRRRNEGVTYRGRRKLILGARTRRNSRKQQAQTAKQRQENAIPTHGCSSGEVSV